mmetsp:Transcript_109501/g.283068  ORF Transcript_109501/g.283068 Transcript_109501/m.283068 type:complete len:272 (+) Transcript_109501:90-905(+)
MARSTCDGLLAEEASDVADLQAEGCARGPRPARQHERERMAGGLRSRVMAEYQSGLQHAERRLLLHPLACARAFASRCCNGERAVECAQVREQTVGRDDGFEVLGHARGDTAHARKGGAWNDGGILALFALALIQRQEEVDLEDCPAARVVLHTESHFSGPGVAAQKHRPSRCNGRLQTAGKKRQAVRGPSGHLDIVDGSHFLPAVLQSWAQAVGGQLREERYQSSQPVLRPLQRCCFLTRASTARPAGLDVVARGTEEGDAEANHHLLLR